MKRAMNVHWLRELLTNIYPDLSDPYVVVYACVPKTGEYRYRLVSTTVVYNSLDPVWNEQFAVPIGLPVTRLYFEVIKVGQGATIDNDAIVSCKVLSLFARSSSNL